MSDEWWKLSDQKNESKQALRFHLIIERQSSGV